MVAGLLLSDVLGLVVVSLVVCFVVGLLVGLELRGLRDWDNLPLLLDSSTVSVSRSLLILNLLMLMRLMRLPHCRDYLVILTLAVFLACGGVGSRVVLQLVGVALVVGVFVIIGL